MPAYIPINQKEEVNSLSAMDKVIVIKSGKVKQYSVSKILAAVQIAEALEAINTGVGSSDISAIGDGTITGAIAELNRKISSIPSITGGTAEPTGGKSGDVYIMYEE